MKSTNVLKIFLGIAIVILLVTFATVGFYSTSNKQNIILSAKNIVTGLDISGGVSIVYRPDTEEQVSSEDMAKARTILRQRLDSKGLYDANIKVDLANNWIEVEIPDETDPDEAVSGLGQTAALQFKDSEGNIVLEGQDVIKATAEQIQTSLGAYEYVVALNFSSEGTTKFAEATANLIGEPIYIYLDETLISYPTVNEAITDGNCYISMNGNDEETKNAAEELADLISSRFSSFWS